MDSGTVQYEPAGHGLALMVPRGQCNVSMHGTGADILVDGHSYPAVHDTADVLPVGQNEPAGHSFMTEGIGQNEPSGHNVAVMVPFGQYSPCAHM
jgi:hypothetical protein